MTITRLLVCTTIGMASLIQRDARAASVAADGGITLWISYDNTELGSGLDIDTIVNAGDPLGGFTCDATNGAREAHGEPDAESSCPGGASSCTGRARLNGDLQRFAQYIYTATDGAHYLRRVYVADKGRSWDTADIMWNMNTGGSSRPEGAYWNTDGGLTLGSSERRCIADVAHHEFGHYFYILPDRYSRTGGYYRGRIAGGSIFDVDCNVGDDNTVMTSNFPHRFVDTTNAAITISYDPPGTDDIDFPPGEELTPALLSDADPDNDGPDRAHHGHTHPFAQDEWSKMPDSHIDLSGVHTEGDFGGPDLAAMPVVDIRVIDDDAAPPGTVLLLDRSGSMGVLTDGVPASQFVQEAGLYLYHSSQPDDLVGTYLYNADVEELFPYAVYDSTSSLPTASFHTATGLTNISRALEEAIDVLVAEHGEGGANGAHVVLMSDGRQTTGPDLWDQVTRANEIGIKIHTMAFGDADLPTMEMIATQTSGTTTEVAEREDAGELKLAMARRLTTIRGFRPIYSFKGPLREIGFKDGHEIHEGTFGVPGSSRTLLFYSFLEGGNSASYDIELTSPDGTVTRHSADGIAERGRFNGLRIPRPIAGEWTYRILGARKRQGFLPRDEPFEFVAYAENRELLPTARLVDGTPGQPGFRRIQAQVSYRYPLTGVDVRAYAYRGGDLIGWVPLYDDGKGGHDENPNDGLFHGVLDLGKLGGEQRQDKDASKIRIDVRFRIGKAARPAPNAHYESGAKYESILANYQQLVKGDVGFSAWASTYTGVTQPRVRRHDIKVVEPKQQRLVQRGKTGELVFHVAGARPTLKQLRISLGQGVDAKVLKMEDAKRTLGASVRVTYSVADNATEGPRDLRVQFANVILREPRVLFVAK